MWLFHLRSSIHTINGGNQIPELFSVICCQGYGALDPAMGNVGLLFRQEIPLKSHPLIKTIFT